MAQSGTATTHDVHEHHDLGFVRTYIFSTDHKMIARQFLFLGLFMLLIGGFLAMLIRWQLGYPETAGAVRGRLAVRRDRGNHPARGLQHAVHDARHPHDLLRGHADHGGVLRQLPDPPHARRPGHGVPQAQHALVLDGRRVGRDHAGRILRPRGPRGGRLDRVRAALGQPAVVGRGLGAEPLADQPVRAGRVVDDGLDQLHHDRRQHAGARDDAVPDAARDLVARSSRRSCSCWRCPC